MNLLLAEVAQATQRLADAGVPSPRTDAEELAAFVHGVKRGELHSVKDADFDARYWRSSPGASSASRCSTSPGGPTSGTWSFRSGRGCSSPARRPSPWSAGP